MRVLSTVPRWLKTQSTKFCLRHILSKALKRWVNIIIQQLHTHKMTLSWRNVTITCGEVCCFFLKKFQKTGWCLWVQWTEVKLCVLIVLSLSTLDLCCCFWRWCAHEVCWHSDKSPQFRVLKLNFPVADIWQLTLQKATHSKPPTQKKLVSTRLCFLPSTFHFPCRTCLIERNWSQI